METTKVRRLYSGISLGIVLVTAFVLVQPTMQTAYAVDAEDLSYDDCKLIDFERQIDANTEEDQAEDAMSMETVVHKDKALTIHVEKEKYTCKLDQGDLEVTVDVDVHLVIYENITSGEVLSATALVTTCLKDEHTAALIGCESYTPSTSPVPVGSRCDEIDDDGDVDALMKHPQEMNVVKKGNIVKEIVAQKEIFDCSLEPDTRKKVDIVVFTEVFRNVNTMTDTKIQFFQWRCVSLITNDDDNDNNEDDVQDGRVESCKFSTVPT